MENIKGLNYIPKISDKIKVSVSLIASLLSILWVAEHSVYAEKWSGDINNEDIRRENADMSNEKKGSHLLWQIDDTKPFRRKFKGSNYLLNRIG